VESCAFELVVSREGKFRPTLACIWVKSPRSPYPASIRKSRESLGLAKAPFVASMCGEILNAFSHRPYHPLLAPRAFRGGD